MSRPKLCVKLIQLGTMEYLKALETQKHYEKHLLKAIASNQSTEDLNSLLLVEHPPVYTVGIRRGNYTEEDAIRLQKLDAQFVKTNRGGLITFHGPGQLVAYPVINLKEFKLGMRQYICNLQKVLIGTCRSFGIIAGTTEHTGVWVQDKKIAAIGVHGRRFVTTHGLALNCNTDLEWFEHIVPCGIEGKGVTSLSQELNRNVTKEETIPYFLDAFQKQFSCRVIHHVQEKEHLSSPI